VNLAGLHILVTRPAEDAREWVRSLESRGAVAVTLPCLDTALQDDAATRANLRQEWEQADAVVFTSPRAAECAVVLLRDGAESDAPPIHAVGEATADVVRLYFGAVGRVGAGNGAEDLARELLADLGDTPPRRFLVPGSSRSHHGLDQVLTAAGHTVRRVTVYETRPAAQRTPRLRLADQQVDTILLASPSAVEGLLNQAELPEVVHLVSIGPTTSQAIRARGLVVAAEARTPGLEGLLEVIP